MHRHLHVPEGLQTIAQQVETALSAGETHSPTGDVRFQMRGETCSFPYRVYYKVDRIVAVTRDLHGTARELALCLASRHHDGHIREAAIRGQTPLKDPWVVPCSMQLLGEYVVEIGKVIEERMATMGIQAFVDFAKENPGFVQTTRRRAISYWDCYYRCDYPRMQDFPSYRTVQRILSASQG